MKDRILIVVGLSAIVFLAIWQLPSLVNWIQPGPSPVVGDVPASEAKEYTFEVNDGARLEFVELAGSITIHTGPSGPIEAIVTKRSFGTDKESARRGVESFEVEPRQQGNTIYFGLGSAARPRRQVDYRITTPPDISVKVNGGNGSITIRGLKGAIEIDGDNVSAMLLDIRGPISIRNKTGDLRISDSIGETLVRSQTSTVQIERLTAEALDVATGANTVVKDSGSESIAAFQIRRGDLTLTRFRAQSLAAEVPKGQIRITESDAHEMDLETQAGLVNLFRVSATDVRVTTHAGDLAMDQVQGNFELKTEKGMVNLTEAKAMGVNIAAGAGNVTFYGTLPTDGRHSVQTSSGSIYLYVVKESAFQLDVSTGGSITVEPPFVLESAERKPGHWRGVINQGTMLLAIKSASGDVLVSSDRPF